MSMTETAYEALREEILTGRIPGDTLWSDREIAQRMNLSRTPIREAIQRLAAEGLVEVKPRRGTRVLPLRTEDVREIHQIAKALELEAALLLSGRSDRDLRTIEQAVDDMDMALNSEDRDAWVEADTRFHRTIVDNCGNQRLAELYNGHRALTDRARHFALYLRPLPLQSAKEHRAMYEAIVARDTAQLSQLYHDHWNRTTDELLELVRRHAHVMPIKASPREETK